MWGETLTVNFEMNDFGQLLYILNENERRVVPTLESVRRKQNNCHNAVMFNYIYLYKYMYDVFIYVYIVYLFL